MKRQAPATSWFYRSGTQEVGPVTSSRLRQLARQGKLAKDDLVRMGRTGDWVPAGTVEWLEAKERADDRTEESFEPDIPQADSPGTLSLLVDGVLDHVRNMCGSAYRTIAESLFIVRQILAAAALVAIVVWLVLIAKDAGLFAWSAPVDALETIQGLGNDVKRLRESEAGDAEWEALEARGEDLLPQIINELENEAGSHNRIAQMLLWSARDCLPEMFADARTEPSAAESRYDTYMQNVALLQENQPIYGNKDRTRIARSSGWVNPEDGPLMQLLFVAMLIADAAIIVWLVRLWRRRRSTSSGS